VVVVDTSNEIAGDGDVPHPAIGRARRMQVPSPDEQHAVMIEAVENHMPEVIVIDEIGTERRPLAARTIAERGVQLIATAHGNTRQPAAEPHPVDLVGGIQAVTLSDEEARRRGTQKTVLERKAPPTFDVLIEIQDQDRLARPELRVRTDAGEVEIRRPERRRAAPPSPWARAAGGHAGPGPRGSEGPEGPEGREGYQAGLPGAPREPGEEEPSLPLAAARRLRRGKPVRIHPYAVSKGKLERALRKYRVPAYLVEDLDQADMVVTLKAQERRQPRRLRDAVARGVPLHVVKSNTIVQMESFIRSAFRVGEPAEVDAAALREVEQAIDAALDGGGPVELSPQNNLLRRFQHQIIERYGLTSESKGEEPYRRVVVYPG
jgi:hypothetical protein